MIKNAQSGIDFAEFDIVRHGAESDERAWKSEFGVSRDVSGLEVERNIFRYLPVAVTIRLAEGEPLGNLVRLIAAATRAGSTITISSALPLPATLVTQFISDSSPVRVADIVIESDAAFLDRVRAGEVSSTRIRLAGGNAAALSAAVAGDPDVAIYAGEVTTAGRVELLPFLHEQSISITAHRFGNPDQAMATLPI